MSYLITICMIYTVIVVIKAEICQFMESITNLFTFRTMTITRKVQKWFDCQKNVPARKTFKISNSYFQF